MCTTEYTLASSFEISISVAIILTLSTRKEIITNQCHVPSNLCFSRRINVILYVFLYQLYFVASFHGIISTSFAQHIQYPYLMYQQFAILALQQMVLLTSVIGRSNEFIRIQQHVVVETSYRAEPIRLGFNTLESLYNHHEA